MFQWPFIGDYYIVALEPNYNWVVIGSPSRRVGWILARTPTISVTLLKKLMDKMTEVKYDVSKLIISEQCRFIFIEIFEFKAKIITHIYSIS